MINPNRRETSSARRRHQPAVSKFVASRKSSTPRGDRFGPRGDSLFQPPTPGFRPTLKIHDYSHVLHKWWKTMRHTCKMMVYENKKTGEIRLGTENIWSCKACAEYKVKRLCFIMEGVHFDFFITLPSRVRFRPPTSEILRLKKSFKSFLMSLKYRYGKGAYLWGWGLNARGMLHPHLLWRGPKPSKTKMGRHWHKRTGCYITDIRPAHSGHVRYIGRNAAQIPSPRAEKSGFYWWDHKDLSRFRRIGYSKGLGPKRCKHGKVSEWRLKDRHQRLTALPVHRFSPAEEVADVW